MFEEMTGNAADAALAQGSSLPKSMSEGETGAAGRFEVTAISDIAVLLVTLVTRQEKQKIECIFTFEDF